MNYILRLLKTPLGHDFIFAVVDKFFNTFYLL